MSQATIAERPYINSNLFSSHYLDERIQERDEWDCDDKASEAFDELGNLYELEGSLVTGYNEDALIDDWIDEVLEILGFGTQVEVTLPEGGGYVDELLFENPSARRDAASIALDTGDTIDLFERGLGIVEAKQWDADFSVRFSEQRPYRNASHQIKHYLESTPENIQWGVLTNGRKWRLYGTKDYETKTYYEVDLPELIEQGDLERFKYFYVFFRPAAFRESAGTTFLDDVWSESETAAQELGEDLQDNVFTALRVLGKGFIETNDLEIGPDDEDELDELKQQSLVLLYRLMFVLYAEARGLIHPEGRAAQDEYDDNFSLDGLRLDLHETIGEVDEGFEDEYSQRSTRMWSRLEDLFRLIDKGEQDLGIPPYNGGLFDHDEHTFLTENEVSNRYLAEVIYRLSTTQNEDGRYVLADYADLDTRHLGSVYEGLLEHQFRIAPEDYAAVAEDGGQVWKPATEVTDANAVEEVPEGGLYVVNDQGERKATGAYYTPDYVVTYIVEETVGPLIKDIRDDLIDQGFEPGTQEYLGPFLQRIRDLQILDPAMGSGHFLTKATGYLTERVMEEVREVEVELGVAFDEQHVRREIAKECIYGVDVNGMAVELAKLSMWLETLAADRPLAFLDHHFKEGNSLVGSDITEVLTDEVEDNGGQITLTQAFARVRKETLEHVMRLMQELLAIDNETLEDINSMKEIYEEIQDDPLYRRLIELANVHTAERFGLDAPEDAYEQMAGAIENAEEWEAISQQDWFQSMQSIAAEENFFHWDMEFPAVFFDVDGENRADAGFNAVIGNPPYVRPHKLPDEIKSYLWDEYDETYRAKSDILNCFLQQGVELLAPDSSLGMITSDTWRVLSSAKSLRKFLLSKTKVDIIGILPEGVFEDASVDTCVIKVSTPTDSENNDSRVTIFDVVAKESVAEYKQSDYAEHRDHLFFIMSQAMYEVRKKIERSSISLGDVSEIDFGLKTGDDAKFIKRERTEPEDKKLISSKSVKRYYFDWDGLYVWYVPEKMRENKSTARPGEPERFERDKVIVSRMATVPTSVVDENSTYVKDALLIHSDGTYSHHEICALINSTLIDGYYSSIYDTVDLHRNELMGFPLPDEIEPTSFTGFPDHLLKLVNHDSDKPIQFLDAGSKIRSRLTESRMELNLNLRDYIEPFSFDDELSKIGYYQPPKDVGQSILSATKTDYNSLRIGHVTCERKSSSNIILHATARFKPDDTDGYETDQWGYTETEAMPAMRLTNLSETEADLIEAFVPVAVDEAGGFANFRETATKTNSLIDRLEELTLPNPDDVADGLKRYKNAVERAEELDEKIETTDNLIDEIVYELYGLTDEEIEIVEESVA